MNDERLTELLGSLRYERMDRAADARARERLEDEWADLQVRRIGAWRRTIARAVIAVGFVAIVLFTTLRAPGDSPLYGVRIAVEDAFANVYADPQARVQYLLDLYDQRQAEAARLEAMGSAASSGARRVEQQTLSRIQSLLPQAPEEETPVPTPSPVSGPIAAPSPEPSASPTPLPSRTPPSTAATPSAPVATPRPTPTPSVVTTRPTPTPVKTDLFPVVLNGTVVDTSGAPASEVCVSVTAGQCLTRTTSAGVYRLAISAKPGQTVTVYAWYADVTGKIVLKGYVSVVIRGSTTQVPTIQLQKY